jgi:hypothetical protein
MEFSKLTQVLQAKGVDVSAYHHFLNQQQTIPLSPPPSSPQSSPSLKTSFELKQSTQEEVLKDSLETRGLQSLGIKLLEKAKLTVAELNTLIREVEEPLNVRSLLQTLLQQRKISIDDFLELDQEKTNPSASAPLSPYRSRLRQGWPEFYLEQKTQHKTFNQYQVLEELARGGMGIVYKAYHPGLNQVYAIKVLIAGEDASDVALERFHREIQATAKLKHPGIIQIVDSGIQGGRTLLCDGVYSRKNPRRMAEAEAFEAFFKGRDVFTPFVFRGFTVCP